MDKAVLKLTHHQKCYTWIPKECISRSMDEPTLLVFEKCAISAPTHLGVSSLSRLMKNAAPQMKPFVVPPSSPTYDEENAMLTEPAEPLHVQAAHQFYKQKKTTRRKVYNQLFKSA